MILVDTSVWVAHFKIQNNDLVALLVNNEVACHPLVIAEIACGTPPNPRNQVLADLSVLKVNTVASMKETLIFIEENRLFGRGCGYIDFNLLASVILNKDAKLWTFDKRLATISNEFGVAYAYR